MIRTPNFAVQQSDNEGEMTSAGTTKISSALLAKLVKADAVLDHIEPRR